MSIITKRKQQLLDQLDKSEKKTSEIKEALKKISAREKAESRKERESRLYDKAANEEALYAMEQMDPLTHLEFIRKLAYIPAAADLIFEYHKKTGGTQYVSVKDMHKYIAAKYQECYTTTKNKADKANERKDKPVQKPNSSIAAWAQKRVPPQ